MASLIGTYKFGTAYTLEIKTADESTGKLTGNVTTPTETLLVDGHFHFYKNQGPIVSININGRPTSSTANVDVYESWAGWTTSPDFKQIRVSGGRSVAPNSTNAKVNQSPVTQFDRAP